MPHTNPYVQVMIETRQGSDTRQPLFKEISAFPDLQGRALVSLFTSFDHNVQLEDVDADILQSVLQGLDLSKGLALMVSSPGGYGIAAERIVRICRSYSGTKDFWAIVPSKAKSAATLICMGAAKILMSPASELGPVDPQVLQEIDGQWKQFSAYSLVSGYDALFDKASKARGRIEPYIQQLGHYDDRDIVRYRSQIKLSQDMAIKVLSSGMLKGKTNAAIRKAIKVFLEPEAGTHAHGRPIYGPEAATCGLKIEDIDVKGKFWEKVYELYVRTSQYVNSSHACKIVESATETFHHGVPRRSS